jgi:hypothetical protein
VNPIYYVMFTTATLIASFVLFRGFNTSDPVNTISLLCGFLIIFTGVYLLNLSRTDPHGTNRAIDDNGIPTDGLSGITSRRSMQMRRSDTFVRASMTGGRRSSVGQRLLDNDEEAAIGLGDLAEGSSNSESDDDDGR